ncbi:MULTISPECIES: MFS transporter [Streptomyces]|uniref:MFS transporter n=1 Tax=Streptomyces cacaoi TaxID=1898 RepID=A0A4Y3QYT1_STRCI|nr:MULTISPECIES: MFS transporter [Streptomyces]QHF95256.1 MFS transporter [Streptomyces sp. NHF165]GEB49100.1 MFS transporter [Streptomyces cacaoi]
MLKRLLPASGPGRVLVAATLFITMGQGAFMTCSALYFTTVVGISVPQLGLGLTIAGAVGLIAGIPLGHVADRRGGRETAAVLISLNGLAAAGYLFVGSFLQFTVSACLFMVFERGGRAALQTAVAATLDGEDLVETRAYLRAVTNVGVAVGAGCAGIALQLDTPAAFRTVLVLDALFFLVAAAVLLALPKVPPLPVPEDGAGEPRLAVLRDRPFALVTLLSAVLALHAVLLEIVVPLWIARHTDAPRWMVTALFLLNTASVVAFQVRLARQVTNIPLAIRAVRRAGFVLCAACALFAASAAGSVVTAVAFLVLGGAVHVYGEMVLSAGSWVLGYDLAPPDKLGQYQGFFFSGYATSVMIAPTFLTATVIEGGSLGWLLLGGLFVLAGLAMKPVVGWAERTRAPRLAHSG